MKSARIRPDKGVQPAYKAVASQIENMLATGILKPGDVLPNEKDLAARLGVHRSTIRESIRVLEDTGYVSRISPRKLVAAIPGAQSLAARTSRALFANRVTMREIWETTLAVEPQLARYAALRATEDQTVALRRNVEESVFRQRNNADLADLDQEFHSLLGLASNHTALLIAMEPYKDLFLPVVEGLVHRNEVGGRLVIAHERIVEAIERRDADVAELWSRRHIKDFERGCELAGVNIDVPLDPEVLEQME